MMSIRRSWLPGATMALTSFVVAACASGRPSGPAPGGPSAGIAGRVGPLTPEQQAASRVTRISVSPDTIELQVGDSARATVAALDSAGHAVDGAPLRVFVSGGAATWDDSTGYVRALEPGSATLYGLVAVPERPRPAAGGMAAGGMLAGGRAASGASEERNVIGRAVIRVSALPVARIELTSVPDRVFVGTSVRLAARAFSRARARDDAELAWSSSDTSVLAVSEHGLAHALKPGSVTLTVRSGSARASRAVRVAENPVRALSVAPRVTRTETGEVVRLEATARDARGAAVANVPVRWSVEGPPGAMDVGAYLDSAGTFVAERPGLFTVTASVGDRTALAEISVTHRPWRIPMKAVGHGVVHDHSTSDLSVFEGVDGHDYAYTGTHEKGAGGNVMYAWDVTDPSKPVITDSVVVDARMVNDVKINDTKQIAVITREGASDGENGLVLLDIRIPGHPRIITSYTEGLTGGVHNTWIQGNLVYAVNDGTRALDIIDISNPASPRQVGSWEVDAPGKYLRDITIRDGLAYVSYWNDGLVILDVGAGIAGGTPTKPVEVSRYTYRTRWGSETYGNTHAAVRYGKYVFVGDEIFGCAECTNGPRGFVHVIDVSDIRHPKEVAWFRVPEAGVHNLWAADGRLYVACYQGGLRVVDITGELRGDLYRQGREIGWFDTASPDAFTPNAAMAWGLQPYKGHVFVSDLNSGLWILGFTKGDGATGGGS